jgi:TM2 domain-containing membrane protein YozV
VGTYHAMGGHGWAWVAHVMLWVGMGGHMSLLMGMVWVWVQIRRKCWADVDIIFRVSFNSIKAYSLIDSSKIAGHSPED